MTLSPLVYEPIIRAALAEDLGRACDLTTDAIVPADTVAQARVVARRPGTIAGLAVAARAFTLVDSRLDVDLRVNDGGTVAAGTDLAVVHGPAASILTGERTALNFLGHLSGIATLTAEMVESVRAYPARIIDTRKTTPGLRGLEKHAVVMGGGVNHRFGLDDGVLIKDNHLVIAGGVEAAVKRAREAVGDMVRIELEVDDLDQLAEALAVGVDAVLLDNMTPEQLSEAVAMVDGRAITEASGGVTLATAPAIAATGVDLISVGFLTHSAPALDVGLDL